MHDHGQTLHETRHRGAGVLVKLMLLAQVTTL